MSCGVGHRCGSYPELLWLSRRLAAAAPIPPLAYEFPYAAGAAFKRGGEFPGGLVVRIQVLSLLLSR